MFCLWIRPPPGSTLFPYTTLFRSELGSGALLPHAAATAEDTGRRLLGVAAVPGHAADAHRGMLEDRKSTRLNSSHANISYAVFCLKKNKPRPDLAYVSTHTPQPPL